jgi:hypothetical protein
MGAEIRTHPPLPPASGKGKPLLHILPRPADMDIPVANPLESVCAGLFARLEHRFLTPCCSSRAETCCLSLPGTNSSILAYSSALYKTGSLSYSYIVTPELDNSTERATSFLTPSSPSKSPRNRPRATLRHAQSNASVRHSQTPPSTSVQRRRYAPLHRLIRDTSIGTKISRPIQYAGPHDRG